MEVMTNVSKIEYDELDKIQKIALTEIYNLPISTPYWGILLETGIWPLKCMIIYRQMMLYRDYYSTFLYISPNHMVRIISYRLGWANIRFYPKL